MRPSFLLTLAGALGLGCGEHRGVTDPGSDLTPALKAEIDRFETTFIISLNSGDPDITSLFGVSPAGAARLLRRGGTQ